MSALDRKNASMTLGVSCRIVTSITGCMRATRACRRASSTISSGESRLKRSAAAVTASRAARWARGVGDDGGACGRCLWVGVGGWPVAVRRRRRHRLDWRRAEGSPRRVCSLPLITIPHTRVGGKRGGQNLRRLPGHGHGSLLAGPVGQFRRFAPGMTIAWDYRPRACLVETCSRPDSRNSEPEGHRPATRVQLGSYPCGYGRRQCHGRRREHDRHNAEQVLDSQRRQRAAGIDGVSACSTGPATQRSTGPRFATRSTSFRP